MKKISFAFLLVASLLCLTNSSQAQVTNLAVSKAYANSAVHVYGVNVANLYAYNKVEILVHFKDSCSVVIGLDQREYTNSTWTGVDSLTVTSTANGGVWKIYTVRAPGATWLGGVSSDLRFHFDFAGSANGVTSGTYDAWLVVSR